jgi:hypothetical protein
VGRRKKMVVRRPLLSPRALEGKKIAGDESRGSIAVTVSWMLTLLATGGGMIVAVVCFFLSRSLQMTPQQAEVFGLLAGVMTVVAAATGVLCLILTLVVYRVRRDRPPISITIAAVFVSCFPPPTNLLLAMRR